MMLAGELTLAGVDAAIVERRPTQELAGSRAGGFHSRIVLSTDEHTPESVRDHVYALMREVFPELPEHLQLDVPGAKGHSGLLLVVMTDIMAGVRLHRPC
jgi:hypothetical protein